MKLTPEARMAGYVHLASEAFEEVVRQLAPGLCAFPFRVLGTYWEAHLEIDLVGQGYAGEWLIGECKWQLAPVGLGVLRDLELKAAQLPDWNRQALTTYLLASRKGFDAKLRAEAKQRPEIMLLDFSPKKD
jgi:uncharacterized protein